MSRHGIGVCMGASTVTVVDNDGEFRCVQSRHGGDPRTTAAALLAQVAPYNGRPVMVTGRGVRTALGYRHISEPVAIQRALEEFDQLPEAVVSFGGQSILVYQVDGNGRIAAAHTFNKCGSGTGEFFLQQVRRLGFSGAEDALAAAMSEEAAARPYVPASRCSVFCKSDCTHATNEGKATRGQIVAGLCKMMADRIGQLLGKIKARQVWVIGGGCRYEPVLDYLRQAGFETSVPPHALHFEAWGASLLADRGHVAPSASTGPQTGSFPRLPELDSFAGFVEFRDAPQSKAIPGDAVLLAVDAGSTTTKLVLMRAADRAVVASYYGYTLGRPHIATLEGLKAIKAQLAGTPVEITGIAATGSGRYLVETFLTDYDSAERSQVVAVNEITCHARAAGHFNPSVACVLEIGGQDAKYTYLLNGVAADFCMNEACSAGTGSFLAEVVKEMFGIDRADEIAPLARRGCSPIRFGEQCSAFIEGDINVALQEGASREDVIAGLCYSICYNYINRVVGNRPIRGPISVQGGTAYNEAFCLAMAGVLRMNGILGDGEKLVVSRSAGLMGAIGAGFELADRIARGAFAPIRTGLDALLAKHLDEGRGFQCQACDYHCVIQNFIVDGHKVPFGGFCRRYDYVRRKQKPVEPSEFDLTIRRDALLFGEARPATAKRSIGLLGAFFDLTYLPFYRSLFESLGYRVELAKTIEDSGRERQGAAFCWPVEQAHGLLASLLAEGHDFYFLPHVKAAAVENAGDNNTRHCCPFVQGAAYYLPAAFPELPKEKLLAPYIDFSQPLDGLIPQLRTLGASEAAIREAIEKAWETQLAFHSTCLEEGRRTLEWLAEDPARMAFVLVGRPYNALSGHLGANKGLSRKLAAAGIPVIPLDFLPLKQEDPEEGMYWSAGQSILKAARLIARHPQLFPVYLTNFSCGPDSFIGHRFRELLGSKPSLTLEFDGHTVNAGFDTRTEAFLDVVNAWRQANRWYTPSSARLTITRNSFGPARVVYPDMGQYNSEAMAAATASLGIPSAVLPPADDACVRLGRRFSSCKECLPYHATLGSMLQYARQRGTSEPTAFLMLDASGPCRLGQYKHFARRVFSSLDLENVSMVTLSDKDCYGEFGPEFHERAYIALATGAVMANVADAAVVLAEDREEAEAVLSRCWNRILAAVRSGVTWKNFFAYSRLLREAAADLKAVRLKTPLSETPRVLITGEVYVRLTRLATQPLKERLFRDGFVTYQTTPTEIVRFEDMIHLRELNADYEPLRGVRKVRHRMKMFAENVYERQITRALSGSGLIDGHVDDPDAVLRAARPYISPLLAGEAILTVGGALESALTRFCGIVVIGPFGCMPTRIASGILTHTLKGCPLFFYEADGAPLPPILESQLEVFSLVARKTHAAMQNGK